MTLLHGVSYIFKLVAVRVVVVVVVVVLVVVGMHWPHVHYELPWNWLVDWQTAFAAGLGGTVSCWLRHQVHILSSNLPLQHLCLAEPWELIPVLVTCPVQSRRPVWWWPCLSFLVHKTCFVQLFEVCLEFIYPIKCCVLRPNWSYGLLLLIPGKML